MNEHAPPDTGEHDQQIAACMMAMSGLTPRDIAQALRVDEQQVRAWLGQPVGYRVGESHPATRPNLTQNRKASSTESSDTTRRRSVAPTSPAFENGKADGHR